MGKGPKYFYKTTFNILVKSMPSIHKAAIEDKEFKKFWNNEKLKRTIEQPFCLYCKKPFTKKIFPVLHHRKMSEKEQEISRTKAELAIHVINGDISYNEALTIYLNLMSEITKYYKILNDTDLICNSCHAIQHPYAIKTKTQKHLKF
jgi:hypothetical protein